MLFILFAAIFSVTVSVTLKLYKKYQLDILQILALNYVSASVLAFLWFKPDFKVEQFIHHAWLIIVMAILLPSLFWCLDRSLHFAGMMKTEVAQRISVVLAILVSAWIYQESFSQLKIIGIALGIIAVVLMLIQQDKTGSSTALSKNAKISLLLVWMGYATTDLLFKYTASLKLAFTSTISSIFVLSAILMFIFLMIKKVKWHKKSMAAGLLLGVFNFLNIALYLQAHRVLKDTPSVVFASMNIAVVVLGLVAAVLIFKEKMSLLKALGAILAIIAVYILMLSMQA